MGVVPSTLLVKVKFPTEQGVAVVTGSQRMARQCLVAIVNWKKEQAEQKERLNRRSKPSEGTSLRWPPYNNYRIPKKRRGLVVLRK